MKISQSKLCMQIYVWCPLRSRWWWQLAISFCSGVFYRFVWSEWINTFLHSYTYKYFKLTAKKLGELFIYSIFSPSVNSKSYIIKLIYFPSHLLITDWVYGREKHIDQILKPKTTKRNNCSTSEIKSKVVAKSIKANSEVWKLFFLLFFSLCLK